MYSHDFMDCKVIPKKIKHVNIRLFEEELDIAEFVALSLDLSYDQLFVKFVKEYAEHVFANNKEYEFNL